MEGSKRRAVQAVKRREMYGDIEEEVRERSESALPVQLRTDGTAEERQKAAAQAAKRQKCKGRRRRGESPRTRYSKYILSFQAKLREPWIGSF